MKQILYISALFLLFSSCKTKQILAPASEKSKEEVIQALLERNIDFRWFDAKMSAYIDAPDEKISGSIHAKMIRDSSVLISLKKFGIEAARVFADRDNYTILYRFDAAYESGHLDEIKKILAFSLNLEDLQQLLAGNIILPNTSTTEFSKEDDHYWVRSQVDGLQIQYFIDNRSLLLTKMTITDNSNRTAYITFDDYRYIQGVGMIAYTRNFTVPYNNSGTAQLELKISSIEINKPFAVKFSIPGNYERLY